MEVAINPNNTNLFPNSLTLHIYKSILLFIFIKNFSEFSFSNFQGADWFYFISKIIFKTLHKLNT